MYKLFMFVSILFPVFQVQASNPLKFNEIVGGSVAQQFSDPNAKIDVLVIMKDQAQLVAAETYSNLAAKRTYVYNTLKQTALASQAPLVQALQKRSLNYKQYMIMNVVAVEDLTVADLQELSKRSDIKKIIANPTLKMAELPANDSNLGNAPTDQLGIGDNIISTGAPSIWNLTRGEGIVVAGQDTGVDWQHPALKNSYRGFQGGVVNHAYSWHDAINSNISGQENPCGRNISAPCDDNGHGTHTIATVVGDDGGANKVGMAPGAQWISCRNMDNGYGRPSSYIECFEFFLAPYPQGGSVFKDAQPEMAPNVVNNSWGCPRSELCEGQEIIPVLEALYHAGIFIVASAGNEGPSCSTIADPPAHHSELTFSVGSHNHRGGEISGFSSRGPSAFDGGLGPDVTAPGSNIRSAIPGGGYSSMSGTSMAGPHVVGHIALMWSANKSLIGNLPRTAELARATATPKTTTQSCGGVSGANVPNNTFGFGQINTDRAVRAAIGNGKF